MKNKNFWKTIFYCALIWFSGFLWGSDFRKWRITKLITKLQGESVKREKELEEEITKKQDKGFEIDPDWDSWEARKLKIDIKVAQQYQEDEKKYQKAFNTVLWKID